MQQGFLNVDSLTSLQLLTYLSFYFTITALGTVGVVNVEVGSWEGGTLLQGSCPLLSPPVDPPLYLSFIYDIYDIYFYIGCVQRHIIQPGTSRRESQKRPKTKTI